MILVDAFHDLTMPNPPSAQFVTISPFVEEYVPREEPQLLDFVLGRLDLLDLS